ncbi:MAG: acylneuraminate cytidylyltransferase family protein [Bacteroidales bacterium]|nr:acylneuraminate cytidylyltransferase family protein [Bacteroidales bacterium]
MNGNVLFVIPARGGSKGIPGKNIKPLAGKPLIGYSIEVARHFADDADICLSTDDPEIARVAEEQFGLKVPFLRPAHLATDRSGTYGVLLHALDFYAAQGRRYDALVLLQPTSPFRTADDVRRAMELYSPDIDMVVTVKEAATNPYYNAFEADSDGFLHISKGEGRYTRRQDAPRVWEYNGAVYVINVASLRTMTLGEFPRRRPCEMPASHSVDLDSPIDWLVAETLMKNNKVE